MSRYERVTGVVVAVFPTRGYAFAMSENDGQRYFLHFRDFKQEEEFRCLQPGDVVGFTAIQLPGNKPRGLVVRTTMRLADVA